MAPPNPELESENDSEVSSQEAFNVLAHEVSPDPSKDSNETTNSCLTNPIKAQSDSGPVSLDLTLHFSAGDDEIKGTGETSSEIATETLSATMPRVFSCNYCRRKFYSSEALGGHQNAHKRVRTMATHAKMGILSDSYTSLASLPLHGSEFRSLGIKAHSAMHQGIMPSHRFLDARAGTRFAQGYLGIPIFMEDEDVDLFWPGSFRLAAERVTGNQGSEFARNSTPRSNIGSVAMASAPRTDATSPDLTLKL